MAMNTEPTRRMAYESWPSQNDQDNFLFQMRRTVAEGAEWWRENFYRAQADLEFAYGEQWPEEVRNDSEVSRMMLTLNMLPQMIHQVTGNAKKSTFGVRVSQIGGPLLDPEPLINSSKKLSLSEVMESIIRDIEYRSHASAAYATALQHAVESGFGWLRIITQHPDDDPFITEAVIEHVLDRWSIILDPWAGKGDFSDARWGAVSTIMPKELFAQEYPDAAIETISSSYGWGNTTDAIRSWWQPRDAGVRVIEFFWRNPVKRTALQLQMPDSSLQSFWLDEIDMVLDELMADGIVEVQRKKVDTYRVKWMKTTSHEILEKPKNWVGRHIPIIPVFGREIHRQRTREYAGIVRWAHDAQLMRNHWFSSATERIAMVPYSPFVMTREQLAGNEDEWTVQGSQNKMVLPYSHDDDAPGPPQRIPPPRMPVGELSLMAEGTKAVYDATGIHQPYLGAKSNETSGRAILARQQEGDTGTYDFMWGLGKSITCVGEQLVQVIPRLYSGTQVAHLVLPDETGAFIPLNYPIVDEETGATVHITPLGLARYACRVDMGPGFMTAQREFLDFILEWQRADPQGFQMIKHKVVQALDIPNKQEISRILMASVPRELLSPEEQQMLPEQEPSPQDIIAQLQAEAEKAKHESTAMIAELKYKTEELKYRQVQMEAGNNGGGQDPQQMKALVTQVIREMRAGR